MNPKPLQLIPPSINPTWVPVNNQAVKSLFKKSHDSSWFWRKIVEIKCCKFISKSNLYITLFASSSKNIVSNQWSVALAVCDCVLCFFNDKQDETIFCFHFWPFFHAGYYFRVFKEAHEWWFLRFHGILLLSLVYFWYINFSDAAVKELIDSVSIDNIL